VLTIGETKWRLRVHAKELIAAAADTVDKMKRQRYLHIGYDCIEAVSEDMLVPDFSGEGDIS